MVRKRKRKSYIYIGIFIVAVTLLTAAISSVSFNETLTRRILPGENIPSELLGRSSYHAHVDFKVFFEGQEVNFNNPEFDVANKYAHLHLANPQGDKVIHIEGAENISLGIFFESLGMKFNSTCFILDAGKNFCNGGDKRVRFFVNGNENFQFDLYEPRDLNRILITYGDENDDEIMQQINNVADYACIYSGKCPERVAELPVPGSELIF